MWGTSAEPGTPGTRCREHPKMETGHPKEGAEWERSKSSWPGVEIKTAAGPGGTQGSLRGSPGPPNPPGAAFPARGSGMRPPGPRLPHSADGASGPAASLPGSPGKLRPSKPNPKPRFRVRDRRGGCGAPWETPVTPGAFAPASVPSSFLAAGSGRCGQKTAPGPQKCGPIAAAPQNEVVLGGGFCGTRLRCALHGRGHRGRRPLCPAARCPGHGGAAAVPGCRGEPGRVAPGGGNPRDVSCPRAGPPQRQPGPRGTLQLPPPRHRGDLGQDLPAAGLSPPAARCGVLGRQLPAGRHLLLAACPRAAAGHRIRGHLQAWRVGGCGEPRVRPHGAAELLLRGPADVLPHPLRAQRDGHQRAGHGLQPPALPAGEHHKARPPRGPAGVAHPRGAQEIAAGVEPAGVVALPGVFPTQVPHPLRAGRGLGHQNDRALRADVLHPDGAAAQRPAPRPGGCQGLHGLRGIQRLEPAGLGDALDGAVRGRAGSGPPPPLLLGAPTRPLCSLPVPSSSHQRPPWWL